MIIATFTRYNSAVPQSSTRSNDAPAEEVYASDVTGNAVDAMLRELYGEPEDVRIFASNTPLVRMISYRFVRSDRYGRYSIVADVVEDWQGEEE